jgi:hypothetical protein
MTEISPRTSRWLNCWLALLAQKPSCAGKKKKKNLAELQLLLRFSRNHWLAKLIKLLLELMIELHFYTNCDYIFDHTRIYLFFLYWKLQMLLTHARHPKRTLKCWSANQFRINQEHFSKYLWCLLKRHPPSVKSEHGLDFRHVQGILNILIIPCTNNQQSLESN